MKQFYMYSTIITFSHLPELHFQTLFLYLPMLLLQIVFYNATQNLLHSRIVSLEREDPMRVAEICKQVTAQHYSKLLQIQLVVWLYVYVSCAVPRRSVLCIKFLIFRYTVKVSSLHNILNFPLRRERHFSAQNFSFSSIP
jgi:hypothetical protein